MTITQRRHLKRIVGMLVDDLDAAIVSSLVELGLVVTFGDTYCATPAGGYVFRQY